MALLQQFSVQSQLGLVAQKVILFSRNYSKNLVLFPAYRHERLIYEVLYQLKMF